jgi:hypothetical protein
MASDKENHMRSNELFVQEELDAWDLFASTHNLVNDASPDGIANGTLLATYFQQQWKEMMTAETLAQGYAAYLKDHLKHYEPYQRELNDLFASLSKQEQDSFAKWKGVRGLKSTAKAAYVILDYCKQKGWVIDQQHLDLAAGQNRVAPFLEYEYVSQFKSKHNIVNDGKPTSFFTRDQVNKSPLDYRHEAEEAAQRNRGEKTVSAKEANRAQLEAESVQGNNHGETHRIQSIIAAHNGVVDWKATLKMRLAYRDDLNRRRQRG